jgi:hypothetical protein
MPFTRSIYRLSLAVLLLAGLLCPGGLTSPALSAGYRSATLVRGDSQKDEPATGAQDAQDFYIHKGRQSAPACGDKDGNPLGTRAFFDVPNMDAGRIHCSKSALTKRLRALQEHFTSPQRLSLYPSHGFW